MNGASRRTAAFLFARWLMTHEFPANLLPDGEDRAFIQDLVYTAIRHLRSLRLLIGKFVSKWPKGELEALLYIGACQIFFMDSVKDYAAVNETVEAAKRCSNPNIPKVVNGVLRNMLRNRDELIAELAKAPLEVRESFPSALIRRWTERFGEENAARLASWHNRPAITYLAKRTGEFVELERGTRVENVEGFKEGEFIVQDPATSHAVALMEIEPGIDVLDACAAPGGKSIQMAWRGASVTSCEINPKRRKRLIENFERLRLPIKIIEELPSSSSAAFSRVLADVPCSNTGVLGRRPDARWNWSVEKMLSLVKLQSQILDVCANLTKKDGILVYSTCSNEPEENQKQIAAFLKRNGNFELIGEFESLPFETQYDGAFAASMRRIS